MSGVAGDRLVFDDDVPVDAVASQAPFGFVFVINARESDGRLVARMVAYGERTPLGVAASMSARTGVCTAAIPIRRSGLEPDQSEP